MRVKGQRNRKTGISGELSDLSAVAAAKADPRGFSYLLNAFLESLAVRNYSERTIAGRRVYLGYFIQWCNERGVTQPIQVTRAVLERYQRYLYHYRNPKTGRPLSFGSQFRSLTSVRAFFKWCAKTNHTLYNPASELELPKLEGDPLHNTSGQTGTQKKLKVFPPAEQAD
jgi:site-specific recombinase XerC